MVEDWQHGSEGKIQKPMGSNLGTSSSTPEALGTEKKSMMSGMENLSPDEVRRRVRERVAKSVAATTGALEGWVQNSAPEVVGEAASKARQTVIGTGRAMKDEFQQTKSDLGFTGKSKSQEPGIGERMKEGAETLGSRIGERASNMGERLGGAARDARERAKERAMESRERMGEYMREHSAEEIRTHAREVVGRQVAATTGALEGYNEQADPDLPKRAIEEVGKTVRKTTQALRGEGASGSQTGSQTSGTEESQLGGGGI